MTVLQFPDRFQNSSVRHEFELKNKLNPKPKKNNPSIRMLLAEKWSVHFDRKMRILMEIK